jgi:predicted choloylglycine hydrolase
MKIKLVGDNYQQGKLHGAAAHDLIEKNIVTVKGIIQEKKADWDTYKKYLKKNYDFLLKHCPETIEEMNGIADGSHIDFDEILLLNIQLYFMADKLPSECTTIIARGQATLDGKTYIVKNRDMTGQFFHTILEREYDHQLRVNEVGVAGVITYPGSGINSNGFSISTTGVWSPNIPLNTHLIGNTEISVNVHVILSKCSSVEEAVDYIKKFYAQRVIRKNLFVIDKNKAAVLEIADDNLQVVYDRDGLLVRSNHFLSDSLQKYNPERNTYLSTFLRYERAMAFLQERHGQIRFQDLLQLASDHANGPLNSLCRHGVNGTANTSYSSIVVMEDGQLWTSLGLPCESLCLSSFC